MKSISGCGKTGVGLLITIGLVVSCIALFFGYASYQQKQVRLKNMPPMVLLTDPNSEATAVTGSYFNVSATAMGTRPIVRVELWLDGELVETRNSEQSEGHAPFYVNFAVLVPAEGLHMIFVRAVNRDGIIGQSLPVSLTGETSTAEASLAVPVQEGESLNDIATANGITSQAVQALNPGLGNQPSAGTMIKVPFQEKPDQPAKPNVPPAANPPVVIPSIPMLPADPPKFESALPINLLFSNIPAAPTSLRAEYKDCKVKLLWQDNANNEDHYLVNVIRGTRVFAPIRLKLSDGTGPAWTEFLPRGEGTYYFYVTAENSAGKQSSNPAWVYVPSNSDCSYFKQPPKQLRIAITDMSIQGYYNVYCYVSLENVPEQRIPFGENEFFRNEETLSYEIPIPEDGVLDMNGKCLGWYRDRLGNELLANLGTFSSQFPQAAWNGEKQTIQGSTYQISVRLSFLSQADSSITASDPTLFVPYDVRAETNIARSPWFTPSEPSGEQKLSWTWDGDPQKIDGFEIFLNGKPYDNSGPLPLTAKGREYNKPWVQSPHQCGEPLQWQVAARVGTALSGLSAPFVQELPPCEMYLRVTFDILDLERTDDGASDGPLACDYLDIYYSLSVRDVTYKIMGDDFFWMLKCGTHSFLHLGGDGKSKYGTAWNVILIPLESGEPIHEIPIQVNVQDHDKYTSDDPVGVFLEYPVEAPQFAEPNSRWDKCAVSKTTEPPFQSEEATSRITYIYEYFPNKCADLPPEVQP